MDIKDVAGLSEPLQKLVQVVAEGMGAITHAWRIRLEAGAIADSAERFDKAGLVFESAPMKSLPGSQVVPRLALQEARRQSNIQQIADEARKALPETVSGEPVDPDWVTKFFDAAQDVSNEQMQQIWGRLLASEVARPGSFSRKTLKCLDAMGSSDAKLFSKFCDFAFETPKGVAAHAC